MKDKLITGFVLLALLATTWILGRMDGEMKGYLDGIWQGRKMVQREAIAIGVAEYEYSDTQEDNYGNIVLRFQWKKTRKDCSK
jgi:hypothetical protein